MFLSNRDTLFLVLRGEWTKLPPAVKTHLSVTLMRTATALNNQEALNLCQHVIRLVKNPWDDPTLSSILQGNSTFSDDEGMFRSQYWEPPPAWSCRGSPTFLLFECVTPASSSKILADFSVVVTWRFSKRLRQFGMRFLEID